MENNFLNLNGGSFPIKIKKKLKNLTNLDQLGEIKEDIKVNLEIERMSEDLFIVKGTISVTFESDCQRCFKNTDINLNLEIKVSVKDKKYQNFDKKGPLEVHYQDVDNDGITDISLTLKHDPIGTRVIESPEVIPKISLRQFGWHEQLGTMVLIQEMSRTN